MIKLEKSNEILEKRLKQVGDETDTDGKVSICLFCVRACTYKYVHVHLCNFLQCEMSTLDLSTSLQSNSDITL